MSQPAKLTRVEAYELLAYYYEKGEYWCGHQSIEITLCRKKAEEWLKEEPKFDEKKLRPNKYQQITLYQSEDGDYYQATLKLVKVSPK